MADALRILVVNNLYPPVAVGGYENECHDVVQHLRSDHEVTVLTSAHRGDACPPQRQVLRLLPFVQHRKRDSFRAPLDALAGVRVTNGVLERVRPELVWIWNGAQLPYSALRTLELSGVPLAYRICEGWFGGLYGEDAFLRHMAPGETGLRGLWARAMRAFNRLPPMRVEIEKPVPAAIWWNSEFLRRTVPVPPTVRPVHEGLTLPSNARVAAFAANERRAADGPPEIMFVGRLDQHKGAEVVVRALSVLRDRHGLAASLVLAGGEEPATRAALEALVSDHGLRDEVRFAGRLDGPALMGLAATAAAWVVPSVWEEPAPMVCTEAALARVPAVLSRVGGMSEMLHEDEHALFFARGDHEGCADALARTLSDGADTTERVQRAYARGLELSHGPYLAEMDAFLAEAMPRLVAAAQDPRSAA